MSKRFLQTAFFILLLMSPAAQSQPVTTVFVPEQVFAGRTEGKGEMRLFLGKTRSFTVEGLGVTQADGSLWLEQNVRFGGEAVESRTWLMRRTSLGHYSASLTEAAGPALGRTEGNRFILRYPLKHWGFVMHQTLELAKDGRTVENYGSIRFWGIPIGHLRETIQLRY